MSNNLKIEVIGKIISGKSTGWYVLIQPESTGYLILVSEDSQLSPEKNGYDCWVENKQVLKEFFDEVKWKIDWL